MAFLEEEENQVDTTETFDISGAPSGYNIIFDKKTQAQPTNVWFDGQAYANTIRNGGIVESCNILDGKKNLVSNESYIFSGSWVIVQECWEWLVWSTYTIIGNELWTPWNGATPVITLNGQSTITLNAWDSYIDAWASALDAEDGNLSSNISVYGDNINTSSPGNYVVTYNVTDSDGNNATQVTRSIYINDDTACIWTWNISTSWSTNSNWDNCEWWIPVTDSNVIISSTASNQPVIESDTSIWGFAVGLGGWTITVNSWVQLSLSWNISSNITFQWNTPSCTTCVVYQSWLSIRNNATLTLWSWILALNSHAGWISVWDGSTAGHLITNPWSNNPDHWPRMQTSSWYWKGIKIEWSNQYRSSVSINGFKINSFHAFYNNYQPGFDFIDNFHIQQLDNIVFDAHGWSNSNDTIDLNDCSNMVIDDTNWENIEFTDNIIYDANQDRWSNIRADGTNCNNLPNITLTWKNRGFTEYYELDPNNKIDFKNCTWLGVDTNWNNPSNWSHCPEGVPWVFTYVDINGNLPNQPIIDVNTTIWWINNEVWWADITINNGVQLSLNLSILSDTSFQWNSPTCIDCVIYQSWYSILNDAILTLWSGINMQYSHAGGVMIWNGSTAGHIVTNPWSNNPDHWPRITNTGSNGNSFIIRWSATHQSSVHIDGLKVSWFEEAYGSYFPAFDFQHNFEIKKFDNMVLDGQTNSADVIEFDDCSNGTITDTTWNNIEFTDNLSYLESHDTWSNIRADGTNCNNLPNITVSPSSGLGTGEIYEIDPHNKINW